MKNNIQDKKETANDLYRIHCYTSTLAKLCDHGDSIQLDPAHLQQIFADIAEVTNKAYATVCASDKNYIDRYDVLHKKIPIADK